MSAPEKIIAEARAAKRAALDELDGKLLLAAYGIEVPRSILVQDVHEAAEACKKLQPPLVLKVVSPDILHKSDVGGVRTGLEGKAEIEEAIRAMMRQPEIGSARVDGFLLEEMAPVGLEVVIGGLRDPQFGPLVMVGLGGILVEVLADVSFRICPIARIDAEEMLDELKGAPLLRGARGRNPVSREAIIDALLRIGGEDGLLVRHAQDIAEADINPLIVSEDGAVAVDARFVLTQPQMNADKHG
ncbi:MAG: acetate--CoA ligase family protein [Burkholderiales bacterium]